MHNSNNGGDLPPETNHPTGNSFGMGMGHSPFFTDLDPAFLTMSSTSNVPNTPDMLMNGLFDGDDSNNFGGLNLFPLLDGGGHIDLAHYL